MANITVPIQVNLPLPDDWLEQIIDRLKNDPEYECIAVEPERETGRWVYGENDVAMCDGYRCDKCNYFVPWDYRHKSIYFIKEYHFCPNCGAKMEEAEC